MDQWQSRAGWVTLTLLIVGTLGLATILVLGGQVSGVLSTVGASVGGAAVPGRDTTSGGGATAKGDSGQVAPGEIDAGPVAALDVGRPELLVIKTGTLELEVSSVDGAVSAATGRIAGVGGYVSGSTRSGTGVAAQASVTFRIPVASWEDALTSLRGIARRVITEQTTTDEVTGQVVDLGARITNLQATEKALQAIMDKATKVSDVLDVQAELTKVRGQIEEATAQRQHLQEQAAYSTLTATFRLPPEPAVAVARKQFDPQDEVDRATARLVHNVQLLETAGIWFGIVWLPILIVPGIMALVVVAIVRRRSARGLRGSGGGPGPLPPLPPAEPAAPTVSG